MLMLEYIPDVVDHFTTRPYLIKNVILEAEAGFEPANVRFNNVIII